MDIVFAAGYASVAALIFWRRSDDRMALFASLALLIFGTATFGFTMPALAADHPAWPVCLLHFLGAACFRSVPVRFPDGRFVPRWTRWVAVVWIGWQLAEHLSRPGPPTRRRLDTLHRARLSGSWRWAR